MSQFPSARPDDPEEVSDAIEIALTQWNRGDQAEALKWLRKAADAAFDMGFDDRGLELSKSAAVLASIPPPPPAVTTTPPAQVPTAPPVPVQSESPTPEPREPGTRRSAPPGRRNSRHPREGTPRQQGFRPEPRVASPSTGAPARTPTPASTSTSPRARSSTGAPPNVPTSARANATTTTTPPLAGSLPPPTNTMPGRPPPAPGFKPAAAASQAPAGDIYEDSVEAIELSHPGLPLQDTTEEVSAAKFAQSAPAPMTTQPPPTPSQQPAKTITSASRAVGGVVSKPSSSAVQAVASSGKVSSPGVQPAASSRPPQPARTPSPRSPHPGPVATSSAPPSGTHPVAPQPTGTSATATAPPSTIPAPAGLRAMQAVRVALTRGAQGFQLRLLDDEGLRPGETEVLVVATAPGVDLTTLIG